MCMTCSSTLLWLFFSRILPVRLIPDGVMQDAEEAREREALDAANQHATVRASEAAARTNALWQTIENTQNTLVSTEASLRKLLDDHLIALTEQMRQSLSNTKSVLLGTLGQDRNDIREEFAEDVFNISSRLAQLANDTSLEGLALTTSLDAAAADEAHGHAHVMQTLRGIEQLQSTRKHELDSLVALLTSELSSTRRALGAIKSQTRARQQADHTEMQSKISSSLAATKAGMHAALQVTFD